MKRLDVTIAGSSPCILYLKLTHTAAVSYLPRSAGALHLLLSSPPVLGTKATEAALRLGLSATAGQSQARRRRQRLLSPVASRPRLRPPHTGQRPCVRTSLSPPASAGSSTPPGPCGCAARCARPAGSGSQPPLLQIFPSPTDYAKAEPPSSLSSTSSSRPFLPSLPNAEAHPPHPFQICSSLRPLLAVPLRSGRSSPRRATPPPPRIRLATPRCSGRSSPRARLAPPAALCLGPASQRRRFGSLGDPPRRELADPSRPRSTTTPLRAHHYGRQRSASLLFEDAYLPSGWPGACGFLLLQMSSSSNGHYPANGAKVLHRKEKNKEKVQLDKNAASSACQKDRHYIEKLETELMNCYQEIDYLQDQLNIRSVEANIMGEHIHSLELKLTELEKFPERVRLMDNELIRSDSQCWLLMEEVRCKEEDLQKAAAQIEKLESTALDSQCEIESLKLDLTNLEQRLLDAESFTQHAADHKAQIDKLLGEHELQLHEAQKTIDQLVLENKQLKDLLPVRAPKQSPSRSGQQVDKTLENGVHAECESGDVILEKMAKRNDESELLIEQLKEELREQKLKAKEDAEDLTQEMAELRYQITGMLEEEYKRRSCIEQAAIQHIQELETQVSKEKTKSNGTLRRLQESHELAHTQAMEIKKLKAALERFNSVTNLGTVCKSCSCGFSAMLIELSNCSIEGPSDSARSPISNHIDEKSQKRALIEWHPGEASDGGGG